MNYARKLLAITVPACALAGLSSFSVCVNLDPCAMGRPERDSGILCLATRFESSSSPPTTMAGLPACL